ncbi:MAG: formylmethanofuran dehydrogenase subunit B [Gammaproteobacteria bacterium]
MDDALAAAARVLAGARSPAIGGLATDVDGVRAAMALADRIGASVDHCHGDALMHNIGALQSGGWMTTTLTEIRNRADLVLFVGTDTSDYPRFMERTVNAGTSMFGLRAADRHVVYLGERLRGAGRGGTANVTTLRCQAGALGEAVGALRALHAGVRLQTPRVAGLPVAKLAALLERLRAARYSVVVWSPGRIASTHGDLLVQRICDLVRDLNGATRCAGFALGGDDGAVTAANVSAWQSGYPLRVDFSSGRPVHDPRRFGTRRLLDRGRVDALLWVGAFPSAPSPPRTRVPIVMLGHPAGVPAEPPAVFIPVGTPGVDHAGTILRADSVVALPLQAVRASALPSTAGVLAALLERVERA